MKFGTLLELNSNIEWWNHYFDYSALKKLFPSTPLDPSYHSTLSESTSILPLHNDTNPPNARYATASEFRQALDKEKDKVDVFYKAKFEELLRQLDLLGEEIEALEARDLGMDDTIKEEDEDEEDEDDDDDVLEEVGGGGGGGEASPLVKPVRPAVSSPLLRPTVKPRKSMLSRLTFGSRRRGISTHEADLLEAPLVGSRNRSRSASRGVGLESSQEEGYFGNARSPRILNGTKGSRRTSDLEASEEGTTGHARDRRTSLSSASSHDREYDTFTRRRFRSLGLVQMDPAAVPSAVTEQVGDGDGEDSLGKMGPVWVWTAEDDYGKVLRIGFKKRISATWLEAYALKQYVDLNLTAFEKILKKYDKNTNSKLKKQYISESVLQSHPWLPETKTSLENLLTRILFLYRRVVCSGDEDLAKDQLRSQLREKVVVDRETVWSQMVSGHRGGQQGIFRSVEQDDAPFDLKSDGATRGWRGLVGMKGMIFIFALGVLTVVVVVKPFERVEESNCLAMLLFCTILWATEAIPLFVTSLAVPLLVVFLRVLRSTDGEDRRLSAADATKYIFSQMFSPTIMLLIGGFTIAAVLSKTRLDVMTATRVLNAAGTKPSVVLLVLMFVATFASMWISNVAAPTLCYALIKPITDELHPKSVFSRCLIIAIALASNIGGQASPISSPQNLIALGSMNPPLSWVQWFAISLPVSGLSVLAIWAFLHINYRWESDLTIPKMRKNTDSLTKTHYFVLGVSGLTIVLWCAEKSLEGYVGDMGIIAVIPLLAFFGTGILSKEDFHSFHWSIVFLAIGGIALGKATLSSGLLDDLDRVLENLVEGLGLYSILVIFSCLALVIATFISHTIAAVLLVPIATRIGESLNDPHPRLLIMATALICSAGMGLPVSGFPNMTAITQENKLGHRFIGAADFLKNGIPASILATFIIITVGYAIMRALGLPSFFVLSSSLIRIDIEL